MADGLRRARIRLASGGDAEHADGVERMLAERGAHVTRIELPPIGAAFELEDRELELQARRARLRYERRLERRARRRSREAILVLVLVIVGLWTLLVGSAALVFLGLQALAG
jgi:hypothetical protein